MKKIWWWIIGLLLVAILVVVLHLLGFFWFGISSPKIQVDVISPHEEIIIEDVPMEEVVLNAGETVLMYLSEGRIFELKDVISQDGLTFFPYPSIWDEEKMQTFSYDQIGETDFLSLDEAYTWGIRDGVGDDIVLTTQDYFDSFLWDANYLEAPVRLVNEEVVSRGNTLMDL